VIGARLSESQQHPSFMSGSENDEPMNGTPGRKRKSPPKNVGVRDLVKGLQQGAGPKSKENLKLGFRGWHERGYLPHRDEKGLTQFVTFRFGRQFPHGFTSRVGDALED